MYTSNFKKDILDAVGDEPIEAVVIGAIDRYHHSKRHDSADKQAGIVLTWDEAAPLLDYEYDSGYGGIDCNSVYIWTLTKVYFVIQYDGATWLSSIPRNPTACTPSMPGG